LPTYYLVISLTVVLSLFWIVRRTTKRGLSQQISLDLSLLIMVFGFLGGRLLHVIYESFEYYREDFMRVFYFWDGGFVFYGGMILSAIACVIYLRMRAPKTLESYLDLFAPVMAFAYAAGRGACLLAGCCYGRYCDLPWAISGRHPAPLYAILWELGNLCLILGLEKSRKSRDHGFFAQPGRIFYMWLILHGIGRLIMEAFRDDFRGPTLGLSISSWISFVLILLGVGLLLKKPVTSKP
ncbi:MAG: prolipoprotein diacylglyceryl transferase, partial [Bdellovibrio sp.]|nr:prolipoprotein diacylglyceryl transferase [Bdellovibrio sp.]